MVSLWKVAAVLVLVFDVGVFSFIYDIQTGNNLLYLNPPESPQTFRYTVTYRVGSTIPYPPDLDVGVNLTTNAFEIAVGQTVTMNAIGYYNHKTFSNISSVFVSFQNAISLVSAISIPIAGNKTTKVAEFGGITLRPDKAIPDLLDTNQTQVTWSVAGVFSPYFTIHFVNEKANQSRSLIGTNQFIQVVLPSELANERYSKTNQLLTVALLVFAVVESISVIERGFQRGNQSNPTSTQPATNSETPPQIGTATKGD